MCLCMLDFSGEMQNFSIEYEAPHMSNQKKNVSEKEESFDESNAYSSTISDDYEGSESGSGSESDFDESGSNYGTDDESDVDDDEDS